MLGKSSPHPGKEDENIEPLQLAHRVAEIALDKKATDLTILDVRELVSYSDYILICSASSDRQVGAVADSILKSLADEGVKPTGVEGAQSGRWVLIDLGDIVVHVFHHPVRSYYDIDGLWPEAQEVDVPGYDRKQDVGYANFA